MLNNNLHNIAHIPLLTHMVTHQVIRSHNIPPPFLYSNFCHWLMLRQRKSKKMSKKMTKTTNEHNERERETEKKSETKTKNGRKTKEGEENHTHTQKRPDKTDNKKPTIGMQVHNPPTAPRNTNALKVKRSKA